MPRDRRGQNDGRDMTMTFSRLSQPAVFLAMALGAAVSSGAASADDATAKLAGSSISSVMAREQAMLRSASGARIAELTDVTRPRARDDDDVTVAGRSVDLDAVAATREALTERKLDASTIDAMPAASGGPEWQCLAEAIYFESRGEPISGQIAVAEVVLNRVDDRRFPRTVCGVTRQGCQFSYVCDGHADVMKNALPRARSEKIASLMLAGRARSLTDGATYFHTRAIRPDWSRRFTHTTTIGHHMFYRNGTQVAGG
jgi:spore germination cell wall hydrolase CwlJ-like protein